MIHELPIVIFTLDEQQYALPCSRVKQIVQAVTISSIPNMSSDQLGVINVQGEIITMINLRHRLGLLEKPLTITDYIVISYSSDATETVGFVVNDIDFTVTADHKLIVKNGVDVIKLPQGLVYMLDQSLLTREYHRSVPSVASVASPGGRDRHNEM